MLLKFFEFWTGKFLTLLNVVCSPIEKGSLVFLACFENNLLVAKRFICRLLQLCQFAYKHNTYCES